MRIWILGAQGMVGSSLLKQFQEQGVEVIGSTRQEADICNREDLQTKAFELKPTHLINCAAITHVDAAETDAKTSYAVNAEGAANAAHVAKQCGARLVHLSTDYVFDGKASVPYREEDLCAPINIYGKSKWEGEKKIMAILPQACILRTSWLFGLKGKNFVSSLLRLFQEKEELEVACDHTSKPTYCEDLARAVITLLDFEGVIHFANATPLSREHIASSLLELVKKRGLKTKCRAILPVSSARFSVVAPRPFYTVLDTSKYVRATSIFPRPWSEVIEEYLDAAL